MNEERITTKPGDGKRKRRLQTVALVAAAAALATMGLSCASYDQAFDKAPVGEVTIVQLPALKALRAKNSDGEYFSDANGLFRRLFRYIRDNDVAMTTPVEAEIEPPAMLFFIGDDAAGKELRDSENVEVVELPPRRVAAIGVRGSYSKQNFIDARKRLFEWLEENGGQVRTGPAFAVYWNSPFALWFVKRFDVLVPVAERGGESTTTEFLGKSE